AAANHDLLPGIESGSCSWRRYRRDQLLRLLHQLVEGRMGDTGWTGALAHLGRQTQAADPCRQQPHGLLEIVLLALPEVLVIIGREHGNDAAKQVGRERRELAGVALGR